MSVTTARPTWKLYVDHRTVYQYSASVRASYNEVRVVPASTAGQAALEARVSTTPAATQYQYRDYWGTLVTAFDIPGAHDQLEIRSTALVQSAAAVAPPPATWEDVGRAKTHLVEYLSASPHAEPDAELTDIALSLWRPDPIETVHAVVSWLHGSLRYVPGVTGVHTPAIEAWTAKSGVCQDFAHLALSTLRVLGVPSRYVSGYFHPDPDAEVGADAKGESHAWIEVWTGAWWGIDPTNAIPAGNRHVLVARGRDYADVPPVKGIFAGTAKAEMKVEVLVRRTE